MNAGSSLASQRGIDAALQAPVLVAHIEAVQAAMAPADVFQFARRAFCSGNSGSASRRRVMPTKSRLPLRRYSSPNLGIQPAGRPDGNVLDLACLTASTSGTVAPLPWRLQSSPRGKSAGGFGIKYAVGLDQAAAVPVAVRAAVDAVGAPRQSAWPSPRLLQSWSPADCETPQYSSAPSP